MPSTSHPTFEHRALFHEGPDELVPALLPELTEGLERGERVLVCLAEPTSTRLAAALGNDAGITYLPVGDRYARPSVAMGALHDFVRVAVEAGSPAAWAVGTIGFDGTDDDHQWHRYEAAVNDVFADLPLRAVCTYDSSALPEATVAAARRTHPTVTDAGFARSSADFHAGPVHDPHAARWFADVVARAGAPMFDGEIRTASAIRDLVTTRLGEELDPGRLADIHLVATELTTNALRHGGPPERCTIWADAQRVVLRIEDRGAGITDPYAELRPPRGRAGGWGLWLVGQLSERVAIERVADRTVVTAAITR